jgi:two-component system response regulator PilR (NtrC family)
MSETAAGALHRILVIDDEPATLFGFRKLLLDPDTDVDTAATVEEAKRLLDEHTYQVVLADLRLSMAAALEGYEVIKHAKKVQPFARVIVVTAYGTAEDRAKVMELGAETFMEKPVSPTAIRSILRTLSA